MYQSHDTDMWNVHIMFIKYIHRTYRNLETRKTLTTSQFMYETFLLPLSLKVLRHKERDTHSFYSGFSICPRPNTCGTRHKGHWPGFGEHARANGLLPRQNLTPLNLLTFSKSPKSSAPALPVHDVIHIHWSTFLSGFYFDIYERHILPVPALTSALKFAPN